MHSPVPTFARGLRALDGVLAKAEAHCAAKGIEEAALLHDRLFPDMLPMWRQVTVACDHAKGAAHRLAGLDVPSVPDEERSFADLRARVARTLAMIEAVPDSAFEGAEGRTITMRTRVGEVTRPGADYLDAVARPNFYFHLTTAYGILRHRGVDLGKRDFLGV